MFHLPDISYLQKIEGQSSIIIVHEKSGDIPIIFQLAPNTVLDRMMVKTAFYNLQFTNQATTAMNTPPGEIDL